MPRPRAPSKAPCPRPPQLDEIAAFARVAELGSFTAAAAQLGVPKSTVSRAVTRLEEGLKVRLLQRSPRAVALTEAGRRFFGDVAPHIAGLRDAAQALDAYQGQPQGLIRLSAPPDSGDPFLGEMLVEFGARYPLLAVEVDLSSRQVDLLREGFDVALRASRELPDSSLVARKLHDSDVQLFASPSYIARRGLPRAMDELADHERVVFLPSARRGQWPLDHADAVRDAMATGRIATDNFQLIRSVLRAGGGIGPLPRLLAAPDLASGRLVHVLPEWSQRAGTLYLVYPSARHVPRNVAVFRDFAVAWLKRIA
ncbi:LysR substrate-binding domain-containing protein [Sorangium sp. So ce1335]|uniref:LysR family transcriptional regulator n=1 Tax=Sorangium sp. So ce1335 TaxID=3133335 RepID=UPI003F636FB1